MNDLEGIDQLVEKVESVGKDLEAASDEVALEEVVLLNSLISKLIPVMRHIDIPLAVSYYRSGKEEEGARVGYYEERGIVLSEVFAQRKTERDYRGSYMGTQLCLTRSGKLIEIEKSGYESDWGEDVGSFKSAVLVVKPPQVVERHRIEEIIQNATDALESAIDSSQEKLVRLEERLKKLRRAGSALA